jgi:hypothetical protein
MKHIFLLLLIFLSTVAKSQNSDTLTIYCDLSAFLISEVQLDSTLFKDHECRETISIYDILTKKSDISVDFGVFAFTSTFISDDFYHYLVKYKDKYFVCSAKDAMLVTNILLELQEKYVNELDINLIIQYIKIIGKRKAIDFGSHFILCKTIGNIEYIYPNYRYK